jgi:hypothetical protein
MVKGLKRFFYDKRAITPVLSSLLLTVVAVAAMAVATTATYVITTNLKDIMSERLTVEDLWFSSNEISIYLYNIGKVSVHFSTVYINSTPFTASLNLVPNGQGWLNVSFSWSSGSVYHVDVVTSRGTHVGDYYKAP